MPVTFKVADHESNTWSRKKVASRDELFAQSCSKEARQSERIIHSSLSSHAFANAHITPSDNGFVHAVWYAYSHHHHLTIRPDDIWFAILSQLNFYINKNAEELRDHFVAHEGKKELVIEDMGSMDTLDYGLFARKMTGLIQQNVKDPNLRDWIMPTFSTTTVDDRSTAAVLMMGSLQAYFSYTSMCMCGIPSITLLGNRDDYDDILSRLDKLEELGDQTKIFAGLLRPILRNFIASFDEVMTAETKDFWTKIAHYQGGSGMSSLSGWVTAFCFWRNDGVPLCKRKHIPEDAGKSVLHLNSAIYHTVETSDIPSGFASVPVLVNDNGTIHRTKMVAGSLAISAVKSGDKDKNGEEKLDTLKNLTGWVMYEVKQSVGAEGGRRTRGEDGTIVDTRY
ncbi:hypothetical protein CC86DRAFT_16634 [Ophiobolus disseminans]|uniref:DUF4419 domain-containing protein n=1 Tax=Ophiobolus disseminans TaxID=1469910 RepID=A0A6A7AMZ1_9PLEO|nr:hypothetical protein CC86DRAFT_16634 [Ophiobolus disseminans]